MRLIQLQGPEGRRVGIAEGAAIQLLGGVESIYALALSALDSGIGLAKAAADLAGGEALDYDEIYAGAGPWRVLPAIDHPVESSRCQISGTGLSHLRSAANRDAMHAAGTVTDSMRMYQWGVEGGRPAAGRPGSFAGMVLQGDGRQSAGAQSAARRSAVRRGWRRGAGDRGRLYHRCAGRAAPHRDGRGQRVQRPRVREEELSLPGVFQAAQLRIGPGTRHRSGVQPGTRRSGHRAWGRRRSGGKRFSPASPRCATAWPIWSTITSSSKLTAGRAISTCISSAPTRSASAKESGWLTAM